MYCLERHAAERHQQPFAGQCPTFLSCHGQSIWLYTRRDHERFLFSLLVVVICSRLVILEPKPWSHGTCI